ncbi:uncharacterized protein MELLADRAFT_104580 [Melampsora larici-populina 98AG31]|uniref:3'(2'),5'-bisphosphate nucleotidase n=1 Tax=Melampsora larici-populina (strain 98AG31 / pathotype 3-4-7) TaxID=747676 RepID=F4RF73_MELLP|nr:uncharacterized protein MELLADRAFT_104580 [Melampsora larici-populina 98AG31]EGG08762.1 hypothetical protein MELLADRAFT_104580 [Melampsora larici-populina 98AG31]
MQSWNRADLSNIVMVKMEYDELDVLGDYGSQVSINLLISKRFPIDKIIGEEEIKELRSSSKSITSSKIENLINDTLFTKFSLETDEEVWNKESIPKKLNPSKILETINIRNCKEEKGGNGERFWTLDPIDGTKGFLRSDQYLIFLSLSINKKVTLSFIIAPNLSTDPYPSNMNSMEFHQFQSNGTFCESWESNHSNQILNSKMLSHLNLLNPKPIRLDSQVKYCLIARGDANAY